MVGDIKRNYDKYIKNYEDSAMDDEEY